MSTDHITLTLPNQETLVLPWKKLKRAKHIRVTVSQGKPRVSSPPSVSRHSVESFLLQQSAWIQSQLNKIESLPQNTLYYRGEPHQLIFHSDIPKDRRIYRDVTNIVVHPIVMSTNSITSSLERWLQTEASTVCVPILQKHAVNMDVEVPQLRFRDTRSRWGSCSSTGAITLNWRLVHAPIEVTEYVIVHELAHRIHMNHSKDFWDLVEEHNPSYRIHRGWLKRHGHLCRTPEIIL
ncbi:M48 family metallopeptidase [Candidatus Woesebacteria bacterium]|nr:M48 family metallopeptidase [Candidatus Woesebacteria bacterium]MCD8507135.1 M48 family metallopeptidase [Candidatus Woesebacteria bacterium]MCD8526891.1 M48 family metallopeptidase [Candidatus Woesebacteria bacterium]MCD8546042.1 M48 family metallopeptidase [Candidatus Woesebacteria bacterium]